MEDETMFDVLIITTLLAMPGIDPAKCGYITLPVAVHSAPVSGTAIIDKLNPGDQICTSDENSNWRRVGYKRDYQSFDGWIDCAAFSETHASGTLFSICFSETTREDLLK